MHVLSSRESERLDETGRGDGMGSQLNDRVGRWVAMTGIDPARVPTPDELDSRFRHRPDPCRPGADPREVEACMPAWLCAPAWIAELADPVQRLLRRWPLDSSPLGDRSDGSLRAPARAFGSARKLVRAGQSRGGDRLHRSQGLSPVGPASGPPIFTSGDDETRSRPRIIASGF